MSLDFNIDTESEIDDESANFNPWRDFALLQKSKKYLYISTSLVLVFNLLSVILLGVAISRMTKTVQIALSCASILLALGSFAAGILQVGIYKEKDLIISM